MTSSLLGIDLDRWSTSVEKDPEFQLAARWNDVPVTIIAGEQNLTFRIVKGRIELGQDSLQNGVVLKGSMQAWQDFLAEVPAAPNHSVLGMDRRRGDFAIEGRDALVRNLRALTLALDLLRAAGIQQAGNDQ